MNETLLDQFVTEFYPRLGQTARWQAFQYIASKLLSKKAFIHIIETGCVRKIDNWVGDGQSTRVWDWLLAKVGGIGESFDIDYQAVKVADSLCDDMLVTHIDSMLGIASSVCLQELDLLYLDSFDYKPGTKYLSALHHVGELAVAYGKIPSGCMIAVDDCLSDTEGKHIMVKKFFDMMGIAPAVTGYITVWEKP